MPPCLRLLLRGVGAVVLLAGGAQAEDGLGALGPWIGTIHPSPPEAGASVDREFPESVPGTDTSVGRTTVRANARAQVYEQPDEELTVGVTVAQAELAGGAVFPESGALPHRLDDIRLTVGARWRVASGAIWGVSGSAGSASDHPFQGVGTLTESATVFTYRPQPAGDAWLFLLTYSDDRSVLNYVPVPGFAYLVHRPHLYLMAGFPMSGGRWTPDPAWMMEGFVTGFGSGALTETWMPLAQARQWRLHAGGTYGGDVYRPSEDPDRQDRIIFQELRWTGGTAYQWSPERKIDCYGGWAMLRRISEGHSFLHTDNVIRVRPGWVVGASAAWRW